MYRLIRNLHLLAGLLSSGYLFMYAWSAVQMSHREWFTLEPKVTETKVKIGGGFADNPRAAALELMARQSLHGELRQVQQTPSGFRLRVARIGVLTDAAYDRESGEVTIREQRAPFAGVLNQMHHAAGLWHDNAYFQAVGVFVAIVSVALILLGATGIYLWFKIHTERVTGGILLAANIVFAVGLIVCMAGSTVTVVRP